MWLLSNCLCAHLPQNWSHRCKYNTTVQNTTQHKLVSSVQIPQQCKYRAASAAASLAITLGPNVTQKTACEKLIKPATVLCNNCINNCIKFFPWFDQNLSHFCMWYINITLFLAEKSKYHNGVVTSLAITLGPNVTQNRLFVGNLSQQLYKCPLQQL